MDGVYSGGGEVVLRMYCSSTGSKKRSKFEASSEMRPYVVRESRIVGGKNSIRDWRRSVSRGREYSSNNLESSWTALYDSVLSSDGKDVKSSSARYCYSKPMFAVPKSDKDVPAQTRSALRRLRAHGYQAELLLQQA